jgi:hypothetical protein
LRVFGEAWTTSHSHLRTRKRLRRCTASPYRFLQGEKSTENEKVALVKLFRFA